MTSCYVGHALCSRDEVPLFGCNHVLLSFELVVEFFRIIQFLRSYLIETREIPYIYSPFALIYSSSNDYVRIILCTELFAIHVMCPLASLLKYYVKNITILQSEWH